MMGINEDFNKSVKSLSSILQNPKRDVNANKLTQQKFQEKVYKSKILFVKN